MEYSPLQMGLEYARLGWYVLPLYNIKNGHCTCGKTCKSPGKHPRTRNGVKDATNDENKILEWWGKWPEANIGIATGETSGIVVLDVDPRNGGDKSLNKLWGEFGLFPETVCAVTGGGGEHFYFNYSNETIKNSKSKVGAGLDIKTTGGYVVAAPSSHKSGGLYAWIADCSPNDVEIADIPEWIISLLSDEKKEAINKSNHHEILKGERNTTLMSLAGSMRAKGNVRSVIEAELMSINFSRCQPPLDHEEVSKIAKSACKYEKGKTTPVFIWRDILRSELGPPGSLGRAIRHVLVNLSFYMKGDGSNCYPTIDTQIVETGYSYSRMSRLLTYAEKTGWVYIIERKGKGRDWRNHIYKPRLPKKVLLKEQQLIERYCPEALKVLL